MPSITTRPGIRELPALLGFLFQPFWVLVTGFPMDNAGFATALTLLSGTYIVGIFVLSFMKDERRARLVDPASLR